MGVGVGLLEIASDNPKWIFLPPLPVHEGHACVLFFHPSVRKYIFIYLITEKLSFNEQARQTPGE